MSHGAQDGVEGVVEVFADVVGEQAENEIAVLLEERVFGAVGAVGVGVVEVLRAVNFDGEVKGGTEQIDFHVGIAAESNGEADVELEAIASGGEGLKSAVEEGFAGAAGAGFALGTGLDGACGVYEQVTEVGIDAIADQALDAGGVVAFPFGVDGERELLGPAGNGAGGEEYGVTE